MDTPLPQDVMEVDVNLTPTEAGSASFPSTPRRRPQEREVDTTDIRRDLRDLGDVLRRGPLNIGDLSFLSDITKGEDVSFVNLDDESEDDFHSADEETFDREILDVPMSAIPPLGSGLTTAERKAIKRDTFDYNKPKCHDCGRYGHLSKASKTCPRNAANRSCIDCAGKGHISKTSQKCTVHVWPAGAPPFLSDEENESFYAQKKRASFKSELTKMVDSTFMVGDARFYKDEFIQKIEAYVTYLSVHMFEFSEALYFFLDSKTRETIPPTMDFTLLKSFFRAFVGTTERQKGVGVFRSFLKEEIFPKRAANGVRLEPMTHTAGFVDMLIKQYFTNIQTHLTQNLKAAFGRYFLTFLRQEHGISKKSAKKGKIIFYTIYAAAYPVDGKYVEDELEDSYENALPLFYQRPATVEQQQLEELEESLQDDEINQGVADTRHQFRSGISAQVKAHQLKYIEGNVPPRKLFAKPATRMSKGAPLSTQRRKLKKEKQLLNKGKTAGERRQGDPSVSNPKFFNSRRSMNKTDRSTLRSQQGASATKDRKTGRSAPDDELRRLAEEFYNSKASNLTNFAIKISAIKEINEYLHQFNIKGYQVIPRCNLRAKHISINPTSLFDCLSSFHKQGFPTREIFMNTIQDIFPQVFKVSNNPTSLKPQTGPLIDSSLTFAKIESKFSFDNRITTDGKDASVGIYRWHKTSKNHDGIGTRKGNRSLHKARDMLHRGASLIGIDPGRRDIVTAQIEGGLYQKPKSKYTYNLSVRKWAEISNRNWRTKKVRSWLLRHQISSWLGSMPSTPRERIYYIYHPTSKFKDAAQFFMSLKYKQLRRDEAISKKRAISRVSKEIARIGGYGGRQVVIAFGNAAFSQTSRGFAPGGNVGKIFECLRTMPNVLPVYVDEYHTSQTCSMCVRSDAQIFRVVGLGTKQDLFAESASYSPVDNPWHVRRCMGCRSMFNRDENSAQNMCLRLKADINGNLPACFDRMKGKLPFRESL